MKKPFGLHVLYEDMSALPGWKKNQRRPSGHHTYSACVAMSSYIMYTMITHTAMQSKKAVYLSTLQVSRYCLLAL